MKNLPLVLLLLLSFSQLAISQDNIAPTDEIKITIIRKASIVGMANKWKIWVNGEELGKLKNSSYCKTTTTSDSLCLMGKVVGPAQVNLIHIAIAREEMFCREDIKKSEYFFQAKMGKRSIEFVLLEEEQALKLLKKAKKNVTKLETQE